MTFQKHRDQTGLRTTYRYLWQLVCLEVKAQKGHNDADACLTAPLVLGVADGVSQIEARGFAEGFSRWCGCGLGVNNS